MIEEHPSFVKPIKSDQKIWRYLDFVKFVDFISSSSLYFTRADKFSDIFEGSLPKKSAEFRNKHVSVASEMFSNNPRPPSVFWPEITQKIKEEIAINCWHMNDSESAAMWKLYLKSNDGIAIQSNYQKLFTSLKQSDILIFIGIVKYIDYENDSIDWGNFINPYVYKRKSFSYENELRAVIFEAAAHNHGKINLENGGVKVKIDINNLVENVYVAPDSSKWITDLVKNICTQFGYNFNVINSKLDDRPVF
jgi:hypothetical protein